MIHFISRVYWTKQISFSLWYQFFPSNQLTIFFSAGVTLIRPEDLEFPNTMTDIDYDTWMLSGSAVMQDGQTIRNGYACDLDSLSVGSRLGM